MTEETKGVQLQKSELAPSTSKNSPHRGSATRTGMLPACILVPTGMGGTCQDRGLSCPYTNREALLHVLATRIGPPCNPAPLSLLGIQYVSRVHPYMLMGSSTQFLNK